MPFPGPGLTSSAVAEGMFLGARAALLLGFLGSALAHNPRLPASKFIGEICKTLNNEISAFQVRFGSPGKRGLAVQRLSNFASSGSTLAGLAGPHAGINPE
jgi:hypothetical protein